MPLLQNFHDFYWFLEFSRCACGILWNLVESIFKSFAIWRRRLWRLFSSLGAPGPFNVSAAETRRQIRAMAGELGTRYSACWDTQLGPCWHRLFRRNSVFFCFSLNFSLFQCLPMSLLTRRLLGAFLARLGLTQVLVRTSRLCWTGVDRLDKRCYKICSSFKRPGLLQARGRLSVLPCAKRLDLQS